MEENIKENIREIQRNLKQSLDTWADIILKTDIEIGKHEIVPERYDDDVMMDTTLIFCHVIFNIGYHTGNINFDNATEFGEELSALIKKYSGVNTKTHYFLRGINPN